MNNLKHTKELKSIFRKIAPSRLPCSSNPTFMRFLGFVGGSRTPWPPPTPSALQAAGGGRISYLNDILLLFGKRRVFYDPVSDPLAPLWPLKSTKGLILMAPLRPLYVNYNEHLFQWCQLFRRSLRIPSPLDHARQFSWRLQTPIDKSSLKSNGASSGNE
jgi:hypothetical protein